MSYKKKILEGRVHDSKGNVRTFTAKIERTGYSPDVYITYSGKNDPELCDDDTFVNNVMALMMDSLGYTGESFGRAEMNMQGPHLVVLEPNQDFINFAVSNLGFVLLN